MISSNYVIDYSYRKTLLEVFSHAGPKLKFGKNALIEFEYKKLDYVYLILKGRVKQYFIDSEGGKRTILILSPGDIFGEITFFQNDFDMVISETLESSEVVRIDGNFFLSTVREHPGLSEDLLRMVSTKFRILMAQIHDVSFYTTRTRLTTLLERLSKQNGKVIEDGIEIDLRLTHEEIAAMIGATRATVSKMLAQLEEERFLERRGKCLVLLDC